MSERACSTHSGARAMRLARALVTPLALAGVVALGIGLWPTIAERAARAVEQRLGAETEFAWTIGAIDFDFGPAVVLRDVSARPKASDASARPLLTVRTARLSGELSLLRGEAGAWRAALEGVAVELPRPARATDPLGAVALATTTARPIARLAAIGATARGVEIDDSAPRMLTARAQGLDLSGRLAPDAVKADVALELETRTHLASVAFSWPPGDGAAKLAVIPRASGQRIEAITQILVEAARLKLHEMRGTVGDAPFTAEAALDLSAQPSLDADIRIGRLVLTDDSAGSTLRAPAEARSNAHIVETADLEKIDPRALDQLRLTLAIAIDDLRIGRMRLGRVTTRTTAADRLVDVAVDAKSFYDGGLRGRYTLAARGESALLHQLSLSIGGARLSPLLADAGGPRALDGTATMRIELQTAGATIAEAVRAADGRAEISLADGRVNGVGKTIDIPFASELLGAIDDGSLTRFRRFGGSFAIKNGTAASNDLKFESKMVDAAGAGRADLSKGSIDFTFKARLSLAGHRIEAPIRVFGPWSDPSVDADLGNALGSSIDALGSLGDAIGKGHGDIGDAIDSLFSGRGGGGTVGRKRSGK